ncbi:MAG: hypothetical protein ACLUNQ_08475 [Oscillospiraceae bacterium]
MNSKPNADIRTAIRESNLCQYQVAEKIGVSEFTFIRWMREMNCPMSASSAFWQPSKSCPQPVKGGGAWARLSSARNRRERLHS